MSRARTCLGALVTGTLLLALGAGVGGCGSKYRYAPENPRNLASPPQWVAHPLRVTGEGALEVVGEARASEARIAFELAELAGRARAARYFRSLARAQTASETQVLDGTVLTEEADARALAESVTVEVGGLMPVERWYDTRARRAYVLLRMPAEEHERLRALYRRQAVEGARDLRGSVKGAQDPLGVGERNEERVHPPVTGQGVLVPRLPPSPAAASGWTPLATVEASGYRPARWAAGGRAACSAARSRSRTWGPSPGGCGSTGWGSGAPGAR